jgi:hypothetical protein
MQVTGQNKLELFVENAQSIKKEFTWQDGLAKKMAALLYAQEGKTIDCEKIRQCHNLIKQNTGTFSPFRGDMALTMAAMLSLTANPQMQFSETQKVYDLLKSAKFHTSDFLIFAAYQIAAQSATSGYPKVVTRARSFYDGMKALHFFHTGEDDYILAAMLGLTDLNIRAGTERIERLYTLLKPEFRNKNSIQALAQVLVFSDSDDSVIRRVLSLRDALRAQKIKLDGAETLPILGILALLPVEIGTIVSDVKAAQDTLKAKKGFGSMSITTQGILLFAASIIASDYVDSVKDGILTATLSTSITNILIAQQVTMMAMISASSAAAVAASSSSS